MDQSPLFVLTKFLIAGSFLCGAAALLALIERKTFARVAAIIVLGMASGVAGLIVSLKANQMHFAALREAGQPAVNDMPGYGQALLFALGLIYFAGLFSVCAAVALWRRFSARPSRK